MVSADEKVIKVLVALSFIFLNIFKRVTFTSKLEIQSKKGMHFSFTFG